jgi:hypothetical protein
MHVGRLFTGAAGMGYVLRPWRKGRQQQVQQQPRETDSVIEMHEDDRSLCCGMPCNLKGKWCFVVHNRVLGGNAGGMGVFSVCMATMPDLFLCCCAVINAEEAHHRAQGDNLCYTPL